MGSRLNQRLTVNNPREINTHSWTVVRSPDLSLLIGVDDADELPAGLVREHAWLVSAANGRIFGFSEDDGEVVVTA